MKRIIQYKNEEKKTKMVKRTSETCEKIGNNRYNIHVIIVPEEKKIEE